MRSILKKQREDYKKQTTENKKSSEQKKKQQKTQKRSEKVQMKKNNMQVKQEKKDKRNILFKKSTKNEETKTIKIQKDFKEITKKVSIRKQKIQHKLVLAFLVPVCFLIILGILSFELSRSNIKSQYEESVNNSVSSVSQNFQLLCTNVQTKAIEIATNTSMQAYYISHFTDEGSKQESYRTAQSEIAGIKGATNYVFSYNILGELGNGMSSAGQGASKDDFAKYMQTSEGKKFKKANGNSSYWSGYHSYFDKLYHISNESYALSYTRTFTKGNGIITVDIKAYEVENILKNINLGNDSYLAVITPDHRSLMLVDGELTSTKIFDKTKVTKMALDSKEKGQSYITFQNKPYLFNYEKIGETNLAVVCLVPKTTILSASTKIGGITIIFVLLSGLIALFIGSMIAKGISKEVNNLTTGMKKVSEGDFRVSFQTKRKDEFKDLSIGMESMLLNLRGVVEDVKKFADTVGESSGKVALTSETMAGSMRGIDEAMEEVAKGVTKQAEDTDSGLNDMANFSEKLNIVNEKSKHMQYDSNEAKNAIEKGNDMVKDLHDKSQAVSNITTELIENITEVESNSKSIGSIIETIAAIAEQTNLLSLNASIEAARAGEAGRGFSVVAEEIRKLADQSAQAGDEIKKIIQTIQTKTADTAVNANHAEEYLKAQSHSIEGTVRVFEEVNENVSNLIEGLEQVGNNMQNMVSAKDNVLDSISSIASVSEQTAASTQEVTATVSTQLDEATKLAIASEDLKMVVEQLQETMKKFKI